jgi:hypothetical protein
VIAEGNETPGGEVGGSPEGRRPRSEGDLLAERRALRAADSGEHALARRAEAAEATVQTLETHLASLQQRLADSEQERRRIGDLLDVDRSTRSGERADVAGHRPAPHEAALERELQRASQREYAEQRLRVEAEDRGFAFERESRAEIERLRRRLSASEREALALAGRLEVVQRELAEAEQVAATERSGALRSERALRSRLSELEGRALELDRALEIERAARLHAEQLLDALRGAQRAALALLGGVADAIARLKEASTKAPAPAQAPLGEPSLPPPAAAAIPPLGAPAPPEEIDPAITPPPAAASPATAPTASSAEGGPLPGETATAPAAPLPPLRQRSAGHGDVGGHAPDDLRSAEMAEALAAAVERLRARAEEQGEQVPAPVAARPPHKHSMSLITRTRLALRRRRERRKQRRER